MKVLLRDYLDKMRALIDARQAAQAITIGQYCLRYYPKQIELYRLLGEACLDSNAPDAASELFQRVLSADPENIVAHVGLALIHEQRGEAEPARAFIVRAFELQPTNPQIRREYARLQLAPDSGVNPEVKLTPAALARLYLLEELYQPALQELRVLTRDDPTRFDLRVGLAETLFRLGQLRESASQAEEILTQLPYCVKANLLLGYAWVESGAREGEVYLKRAREVDPEGIFAKHLFGERMPHAVDKPQLPSIEEVEEQEAHRDLARELDTALFGAPGESLLSFQAELTGADQPAPETPAFETTEVQVMAEETPSVATVSRAPLPRKRPEITAALGAIPPWLHTLIPPAEAVTSAPSVPTPVEPAPSEAREPVPTVTPTAPAVEFYPPTETPVETRPLESLKAVAETETPIVEPPMEKAGLPDWLSHVEETVATASEQTREQVESPAWLTDLAISKEEAPRFTEPRATTEPVAPFVESEVIPYPDWLMNLASEQTTVAAYPAPIEEADWLKDLSAPSQAPRVEESRETIEPAVPAPEGKVLPYPAWFKDIPIAKQAPPVEEPRATIEPAAPVTESEVIPYPDWLLNLTGTQPAIRAEEPLPPASEPVAPIPATRVEPPQPVPEAPPSWLSELSASATVESEPQVETPAAEPISPQAPDWLKSLPTFEEREARGMEEPVAPPPPPREEETQAAAYDAEAVLRRARALMDAGDLNGAIKEYEHILHRAPSALNDIIHDLERLLQLPKVPNAAHRVLGDAYSLVGRYKEAVEQYRQVLGRWQRH